jgi:hypothetical protein
MTREEVNVIKAGLAWWKTKRPVAWKGKAGHRLHLDCPQINCVTPQEKALAYWVVRYLRSKGERGHWNPVGTGFLKVRAK